MSLNNTYHDELLLQELRSRHDAATDTSLNLSTFAPGLDLHDRPFSASPERSDHRVVIYIGDFVYRTSIDTLCCVEGSRFPELLRDVAGTRAGWQLTIDRNAQMFGYILDYLRATSSGLGSLAPLPCEADISPLLAEASFYRLPGLVAKLQKAPDTCTQQSGHTHVTTASHHDSNSPSLLKFANAYAVISSSEPTFDKAQMQQLTQQINRQTSALQKKGYAVKDLSSGMNHNAGSTQEAYSLHINVLMAATTKTLHEAAGPKSECSARQPHHIPFSTASTPHAKAAPRLMPQQTDPLPKLRQRLKSSTAQLPPMTYVSKDEDFDLITPPQESCRHRSSWLRCPHSPDPLQQTKANGISKAVCRPEPTAAEQSGVAMLLTQDSSSTTEVDWLDTDYVDPPVSCECQPSHMVGTNTSLPSFGSTGTSCRTADNNSISQTPARPTVDAGVRQSATDATPNQLAYLGSSPSSSSSSSVHSSQSHGYSAAGAFPEQQQSGCMQHQAFDDLFDTRQSSFLTTQQAAAEPCFQLAGTIDTDHLRQPQIPGHGLLLSLNTADSLPSTSGGTAASLHQLQFANYVQAGIDSASDSPANSSLFQPPCPEATTQAAAEQSRLDQTDTVNRDASHELAPGVGVVSTSHLEIMGWDLFADTLGTFRLLSDSASEPASQRSLPEPSDFGPVTPGADVNEIKCTPHCLTARTSFVHARHDISISDSQDLRAFEDCLPDADGQVYARHDEQCDSVPCKHDKFAYVLLESPRVGYVQSEASRLAHLDAMQPCGKQKQSSCGCYSLFRQRDSETTPRTSFKEWCTRFCAKRKACLYPCVSLVTHHHAD